jgi:phosphoribosyl 1,2-cyclic phosphate phosphodiesterase
MAPTGLSIVFLGTGTSVGVPVIGCDCGVGGAAAPRDRRTRSSIYVATPEAAWVVDTGTDFRAQALRENIRRLDAVVITHAHSDHIMGFDDLRPYCWNMRPLPVYAAAETLDALRRAFAWAFDGQHRYPGYLFPDPRVVDGPFRIGETEIVPLPVVHGKARVNGFLFRRGGRKVAAYLSDVKSVPPATLELMAGVEVLIVDGLRHAPHPTHLSVGEALAVASAAGAGRTWLTHLCHELGHAELSRDVPPGVGVAFDGLRLDL